MKKISIGIIMMLTAFSIVACDSSKQKEAMSEEVKKQQEATDITLENDQKDKEEVEENNQEDSTNTSVTLTAVDMIGQGNPKKINLSDIAEVKDEVKAWIKLSTQYDPDLSMFSYDSLAEDTIAMAVSFTVSDFDLEETTLYWCYQLKSGEKTIAVWDTSSPADTLMITEDGTYQMLFDAEVALGGTIDTIESLQILFPCGSEFTSTMVNVSKLLCITNADELSHFSTG